MPMPGDVPMPTKIRATSRGPYDVASAQPTPAAIPITLTMMYIHLRPYTVAIGDQTSGAIPANTIASVVVYDVVVMDRSKYSDRGRNPAFHRDVSIVCSMIYGDPSTHNCSLRKGAQEGKEAHLEKHQQLEPGAPFQWVYNSQCRNLLWCEECRTLRIV